MASPPELVADYPRPPALVPTQARIEAWVLGEQLVHGRGGWRVLETFHPPTIYVPASLVRLDLLQASPGQTFCEWKGVARYFDVVVGSQRRRRALWQVEDPTPAFRDLAGCYSLYPGLMDSCWLDGEAVRPQQGGFYGGWITSQVQGPFKGDPNHPELV